MVLLRSVLIRQGTWQPRGHAQQQLAAARGRAAQPAHSAVKTTHACANQKIAEPATTLVAGLQHYCQEALSKPVSGHDTAILRQTHHNRNKYRARCSKICRCTAEQARCKLRRQHVCACLVYRPIHAVPIRVGRVVAQPDQVLEVAIQPARCRTRQLSVAPPRQRIRTIHDLRECHSSLAASSTPVPCQDTRLHNFPQPMPAHQVQHCAILQHARSDKRTGRSRRFGASTSPSLGTCRPSGPQHRGGSTRAHHCGNCQEDNKHRWRQLRHSIDLHGE